MQLFYVVVFTRLGNQRQYQNSLPIGQEVFEGNEIKKNGNKEVCLDRNLANNLREQGYRMQGIKLFMQLKIKIRNCGAINMR